MARGSGKVPRVVHMPGAAADLSTDSPSGGRNFGRVGKLCAVPDVEEPDRAAPFVEVVEEAVLSIDDYLPRWRFRGFREPVPRMREAAQTIRCLQNLLAKLLCGGRAVQS
jgi:hypothetical protein